VATDAARDFVVGEVETEPTAGDPESDQYVVCTHHVKVCGIDAVRSDPLVEVPDRNPAAAKITSRLFTNTDPLFIGTVAITARRACAARRMRNEVPVRLNGRVVSASATAMPIAATPLSLVSTNGVSLRSPGLP
jgi:hypothetical protein